METFEQLVQHLRKFPGVGNRQARRFAYFLLQSNENYTHDLINLLQQNKKHMRLCPISYQYFYSENSSINTSPIVRNPERDSSLLMVVGKDMDIESIEQTHAYKGWYFVLGGLVSIVRQSSPVQIRIQELQKHIEKRHQDIKEIIFGLPLTPDGEHTRTHIMTTLQPLTQAHNIKQSTLGRGLSTGTELEYVDEATFENAFQNRT